MRSIPRPLIAYKSATKSVTAISVPAASPVGVWMMMLSLGRDEQAAAANVSARMAAARGVADVVGRRAWVRKKLNMAATYSVAVRSSATFANGGCGRRNNDQDCRKIAAELPLADDFATATF